ncbi:MAG TPA: MFS transporter [Burkholderiales bacterium]|nr:MFS transporter [Burkholderiales bacterium]
MASAAPVGEAVAPLPARLIGLVFLPFATGYFLSYFFRNVNAVIAKDLAREFALAPSDLGLLTSAYLVTFGLFQLPLGVLLDRFGPRRVVASLLCVTALGAALFGIAEGVGTLALGRALIGLGVSACLMGSIKAFTLWFPLSRLATLSGWFIFLGSMGGLVATAPVEAALGSIGWRAMFYGLAAASLAAAALIAICVPEKPLPGAGAAWAAQFRAVGRIFRLSLFWRIALPFIVTHATYQALQGLWLGPWLTDVAGLGREGAARLLFVTAGAYAVGSVFFGSLADRLAARGISRLATYKVGLAASFVAFLCMALDLALPRAGVLAIYGFTVISGAIAFALVASQLPPEMSGRAITAANFAHFTLSFAFQWGIGAVLRAYPVADGLYAPEGYTTALVTIGALQLAALAWLLPLREKTPAAG